MITIKIPGDFYNPDYDNFWDLIEDGVKDLVKVLQKLGYNTVGSCEGHIENKERKRYVRISFHENNTEEEKQLIELVNKLVSESNGRYNIITHNKPTKVKQRDGSFKEYHYSLYIFFTDKVGSKELDISYKNLISALKIKKGSN